MKILLIQLFFWYEVLANEALAHDHPIAHTHTSTGPDFSYGILLYLVLAMVLVSYIGRNLLSKKDGSGCKLEKGSN